MDSPTPNDSGIMINEPINMPDAQRGHGKGNGLSTGPGLPIFDDESGCVHAASEVPIHLKSLVCL